MAKKRSYLVPVLKAAVWGGALIPLGILIYLYFSGGLLLLDPIEEIQHRTGITVLILLFLTLSMTSLRRLTGWNKFTRFRRLLGLFAFFYAMLHAFSYFVFDQELSLSAILKDVVEHTWVLVGFTAFVLLIPLALTSTSGWIRRLGGKRWTRLHALIYPIAMLGVLHFYWLVKKDASEPIIYAVILAVILGARILGAWTTGARTTGARTTGARTTGARTTGARTTGARITGARIQVKQKSRVHAARPDPPSRS